MSATFPIAFGRYQLVERLAVGGMAELFLADVRGEHGFAKKVVIKRILPQLAADPHFTSMFIAEAKITARLIHPKIAQTHRLGHEAGALFIEMEYVDGLDVLAMLRECAHRRVRLPVEISVYIMKEILDGLDFAHRLCDDAGVPLGVVHRDISPSNVLVSRRGNVKLVDFGIAQAAASEQHTKAGTLKGKYGYMSPEQVLGAGVTAQSDLFSVGVVMAEMLMGRRLFAAINELDVLLMVRDVNLSRLERYGSHIPAELDGLVRRGLSKDAGARFASAADMRDALDDWLFQSRLRVGAGRVGEVVESLYEDAHARRRVGLDDAAPGPSLAVPMASALSAAAALAPLATASTIAPLIDRSVFGVPQGASVVRGEPATTIEVAGELDVASGTNAGRDTGLRGAAARETAVGEIVVRDTEVRGQSDTEIHGIPFGHSEVLGGTDELSEVEIELEMPSGSPSDVVRRPGNPARAPSEIGRVAIERRVPVEPPRRAPADAGRAWSGAPQAGRAPERVGALAEAPATRTRTGQTAPLAVERIPLRAPAEPAAGLMADGDDDLSISEEVDLDMSGLDARPPTSPRGPASQPRARQSRPWSGVIPPPMGATAPDVDDGIPISIDENETHRVTIRVEPTSPRRGAPRDSLGEPPVDLPSGMSLSGQVSYPSIHEAVHSLSPAARDPAARDFDDVGVPGMAVTGTDIRSGAVRLPTIAEIQAQPRPQPPLLDEIAQTPAEQGDLAEVSAIRILFQLITSRADGLLVVAVGGIRKEIYIRGGVPTYVSSNVASELFGAYLVGEGAVSSGELDMALAMMPHFGGKLGDTLVGLGLMKPLDVFRLLTRQIRHKLIDVCTWGKGLYTWYQGRQNQRDAFPLDLDPYEVLGAGALALRDDFLWRWSEGLHDMRPRAVERADVKPDQLKIGRIGSDVLRMLDGRTTVAELIARRPGPEERLQLLRVLFLFLETGLAVPA